MLGPLKKFEYLTEKVHFSLGDTILLATSVPEKLEEGFLNKNPTLFKCSHERCNKLCFLVLFEDMSDSRGSLDKGSQEVTLLPRR